MDALKNNFQFSYIEEVSIALKKTFIIGLMMRMRKTL